MALPHCCPCMHAWFRALEPNGPTLNPKKHREQQRVAAFQVGKTESFLKVPRVLSIKLTPQPAYTIPGSLRHKDGRKCTRSSRSPQGGFIRKVFCGKWLHILVGVLEMSD